MYLIIHLVPNNRRDHIHLDNQSYLSIKVLGLQRHPGRTHKLTLRDEETSGTNTSTTKRVLHQHLWADRLTNLNVVQQFCQEEWTNFSKIQWEASGRVPKTFDSSSSRKRQCYEILAKCIKIFDPLRIIVNEILNKSVC